MLLNELNKLSSLMVLVLAAVGCRVLERVGERLIYIYIGITSVITNKPLQNNILRRLYKKTAVEYKNLTVLITK
jgi:hypothetical protein